MSKWHLATDSSERLYVADQSNNRVVVYEPPLFATDTDGDGVFDHLDQCKFAAPRLGIDTDQNDCTDAIADLKNIVNQLGYGWPSNVQSGLLGKLDEAQKALDRGSTNVAKNKLQDFIDQVEGQRGKAISPANADYLEAYARGLITLITT